MKEWNLCTSLLKHYNENCVNGASGHVGNNLCRMLVEQGHEVKAMVHLDTKGLEGLPVELVKGSIISEADLEELCTGCETVFHLAAYISIHKRDPKCLKINYESSIRLHRAARAKGVKKIVHFSSIHAYRQEPLNVVLNESATWSSAATSPMTVRKR